jgi:uncharacterized membrane protein
MMDAVQSWLAGLPFPNVHAMVVHFPVALLPTALVLDLAALAFRKRIWIDRAASTLYVVGTLGAAAAYQSGRVAAAEMWKTAGQAQAVLADHQDLALVTLLSFCVVTLLRLAVTWLGREDWRIKLGFFRLLALVASVAALVLLLLTAERGGSLVYEHGMGIRVEARL